MSGIIFFSVFIGFFSLIAGIIIWLLLQLKKKKRIIVFAALFYAVFTLIAFCLFKKIPSQDFEPVLPPFKNPVEEKIQKMSLEEKVEQLMFVGNAGNDKNFGGIIFNQQSAINNQQLLKSYINDLIIRSASESGVIPFIGVDQEGGLVCRLDWLDCTGQRKIETASEAAVLALKRGKELKDLNFNVVFAPVLDIAENENDFIYPRTFNGPVAKLGAAMIRAFNSQGIIACPKHFPGHGGTSVDSHYQLPVIECDETCLQGRIEPFKKAIQVGVRMLMIGHLAINNMPSSLSKTIITDLLRNELKFNGVVITDDLNMGAVRVYEPDIAEAAVQAILAGADMVMVTGKPAIQETVYQRLLKAVELGEISETRINESLRRILELKTDNYLLSV